SSDRTSQRVVRTSKRQPLLVDLPPLRIQLDQLTISNSLLPTPSRALRGGGFRHASHTHSSQLTSIQAPPRTAAAPLPVAPGTARPPLRCAASPIGYAARPATHTSGRPQSSRSAAALVVVGAAARPCRRQ